MRKLFKERKLIKGGKYMRKYGNYIHQSQLAQRKSGGLVSQGSRVQIQVEATFFFLFLLKIYSEDYENEKNIYFLGKK